jgi:predicted nucleic acid-binding Zn ribbon protein
MSAARPKKMADILSELMMRRGYARVQAQTGYHEAWTKAAGELMARYTRVGAVKRGVMEVVVANSTLVQELSFQKPNILQQLNSLLPHERIVDLRCRVGPIQ